MAGFGVTTGELREDGAASVHSVIVSELFLDSSNPKAAL
jgi:hypothetical protein